MARAGLGGAGGPAGASGTGDSASRLAIWRLWGLAHKSLRAEAAAALTALGSVDAGDPGAWAPVQVQVSELLRRLQGHQRLEADLLHAALEARDPGASTASGQAHAALHEELALLLELCAAVGRRHAADRHAAAQALYRALALLTARCWCQFEHEESADAARLAPLIDAEECRRLARDLGPPRHPGTLTPGDRAWLAALASPGDDPTP